jgi:hypothetical protein
MLPLILYYLQTAKATIRLNKEAEKILATKKMN